MRQLPKPFDNARYPRKRPINEHRNQLAEQQSQVGRQPRNDAAQPVAGLPQHPIPRRAVVKRIIEIDQKGGSRLELARDMVDSRLRIRDVVQNPERKCEIERNRRQWYVVHACEMKADILSAQKIFLSHDKRIWADFQKMKMSDARRHHHRPTSASAADIHPDPAALRQTCPRKGMKVGLKDRLALLPQQFVFSLPEGRPFMTKSGNDNRVDIDAQIGRALRDEISPTFVATGHDAAHPDYRTPLDQEGSQHEPGQPWG